MNKIKSNKPKMLLIHGWNWTNYHSLGCSDAWADRQGFVDRLSEYFDLVKVDLPGFGINPDPKKPMILDGYTAYVYDIYKKENPDFILGYSFGGAIALHLKAKYQNIMAKVILVSSAIVRKYNNRNLDLLSKIANIIIPTVILSVVRDFYLSNIVRNPYYRNATKVMRETYRNIVGLDLRTELKDVSDTMTLIYGGMDTATPPELV